MNTTIENQAARGDSLQRAGSDDATENFCEICCARKVAPPEYPNDSVCCCKGLQPYALSRYPGEYKLVPNHPNGPEEQWYKRSEVDAKLDELDKSIAAHPAINGWAWKDILASEKKERERLAVSKWWWRHRCEVMQEAQIHMRDPERKIVCDILANGSYQPPTGGVDCK